jgi:hypothetical protein
VGLLLPEPPCLSFIAQPTKRCLSFRFIGDAIERVATCVSPIPAPAGYQTGTARMIALEGMHLSVNYLNVGPQSVSHERVGVLAG